MKMLQTYLILIGVLLGVIISEQHPPVNLSIAKNNVEAYYETGQYDSDMNRVVKQAIAHFDKIPVTTCSTVVLDIDDTSLSTFCEDKAISYGHIKEFSQAFEERGHLAGIHQTKQLYDYLKGRGFRVMFLTGRAERARKGTAQNLEEAGYSDFDALIMRQPDEEQLTALAYKSAHRALLEQEGVCIVGTVGDQWSDLRGGHAGYQVKLPNYRYLIP